MKDQRPVFLDLTKISFPLTAIISILHRISGALLFLFIPMMLLAFHHSLRSREQFMVLHDTMALWWVKMPVLALLFALVYHLVAGLRHMVMDFGFWEEKISGTRAAMGVLIVSSLFCILLGVWIW